MSTPPTTTGDAGRTRPDRPDPLDRLARGPAGTVLHTQHVAGVRLDVRVLDPDADLDLLHAWVTHPRAAFWGLADLPPRELRDLYAHVDALPTHHAFLVLADGEPVVLLQTYAPEHDPVADAYDPRPGDVGVHFLLGARGPAGTPVWALLAVVLHAFVVDRPGVRRVVVEPDVGNAAALSRVRSQGFVPGPVVRVGEKTAQLAFLTREASAEAARHAEVRLARRAVGRGV